MRSRVRAACISASGRRADGASRWCSRRACRRAADARGQRLFFRRGRPRPAPGPSTASGWTTIRNPYPDPASRFQPQGPHGPSEVIDPSAFAWTDRGWRGVGVTGQVIYEMHVGTFTPEGTWEAAARELPELADLGVTVLEVMPVADFPGRFGWGYDGVNLFAPTRLYGRPDDLRRFVDRAHAAGLGVILDVVYNHFGPDGNYLGQFSKDYFTDRYKNEWGEAINFDGPDAGPVREFFVANAGYWIDEFHLDGLRLDATQQIFDASPEHILAAIGRRVREAARGRATLIVAENEPQEARLVRPLEQGRLRPRRALERRLPPQRPGRADRPQRGLLHRLPRRRRRSSSRPSSTAISTRASATPGRRSGAARRRSTCRRRISSTSSKTTTRWPTPSAACGCTALTSPGRYRAMTALMLLAPGTPMLFQGQEFAASSPFLYFADHPAELAKLVRKGRAEFLTQFPQPAALRGRRPPLADPADPQTFERCKLDFSERQSHAAVYALHRDLLRLRREDPSSAPSGRAAWTAPCWPPRRSSCASSATTATTGCCWSISAATCTSTRPRSRCWRRRKTRSGTSSGRAKTPCYGGMRHAAAGHGRELAHSRTRGRRARRRGRRRRASRSDRLGERPMMHQAAKADRSPEMSGMDRMDNLNRRMPWPEADPAAPSRC